MVHTLKNRIDLDEFMDSEAHAKSWHNTTAKHLSKIWRIDIKNSRETVDITLKN